MNFITASLGEQERYSKNSGTIPKKTIFSVSFAFQTSGHALPFVLG